MLTLRTSSVTRDRQDDHTRVEQERTISVNELELSFLTNYLTIIPR